MLSVNDFDYLISFSFVLESLGLLCFYAGYAVTPNITSTKLIIPKPKYLPLKACVWVGFSALGLIALSTIGGGIDQVLMQRGLPSDQRIAAQVGGQWAFIAGLGILAPTVWLAFEPKAIRNRLFWIVLVIALIIKFAATGSRGGTIAPLLIIGAIYILQHKTIPYRAIILGAFFALLIVGAGGHFRTATMQSNFLGEIQVEGNVFEWVGGALEEMQGQGAENSGQIAILGMVPDKVPYLWGESYLSVPFVFLPSAIFGEKPDAGGRLLSTRIYGNPLNTIPPKSVGEAYWNFSYIGVIIVFLLQGVILKLIAGLFRANPTHPLALITFVYFLFRFQLNSDSLYSFAHSLFPLILIYFSFCFFKRKR